MSMFPSTDFIADIYNLITSDTPYLALYTTNPTVDNTGTEVTGGSYARQAITFGSVSNGSISNSAEVVFSGVPTATITHFGVLNASSDGDLKVFGALNSSVPTISGDQIKFPVGTIQINLAGS